MSDKETEFEGFCGDPYMVWSPFGYNSICRNCKCFIPAETGKPNAETCSELGVEGWSLHDITDVQLTNKCIFVQGEKQSTL